MEGREEGMGRKGEERRCLEVSRVVHRQPLHSAEHQGPKVGGPEEGSCPYNVTLSVPHLSEALGSKLGHM